MQSFRSPATHPMLAAAAPGRSHRLVHPRGCCNGSRPCPRLERWSCSTPLPPPCLSGWPPGPPRPLPLPCRGLAPPPLPRCCCCCNWGWTAAGSACRIRWWWLAGWARPLGAAAWATPEVLHGASACAAPPSAAAEAAAGSPCAAAPLPLRPRPPPPPPRPPLPPPPRCCRGPRSPPLGAAAPPFSWRLLASAAAAAAAARLLSAASCSSARDTATPWVWSMSPPAFCCRALSAACRRCNCCSRRAASGSSPSCPGCAAALQLSAEVACSASQACSRLAGGTAARQAGHLARDNVSKERRRGFHLARGDWKRPPNAPALGPRQRHGTMKQPAPALPPLLLRSMPQRHQGRWPT